MIVPYPHDFEPTFHRYLLDEQQRWKKPRTIFVCSMADLFGDWVPDEWIQEVFKACDAAPQHRYLFLTKNPKRYVDLYKNGILRVRDSFWYGTTVTSANEPFFYSRMPDDKLLRVVPQGALETVANESMCMKCFACERCDYKRCELFKAIESLYNYDFPKTKVCPLSEYTILPDEVRDEK